MLKIRRSYETGRKRHNHRQPCWDIKRVRPFLPDWLQLSLMQLIQVTWEGNVFESDIKLIVVKNTLLQRALEQSEINFEELYPVLKGTTSIMFSNTGNGPAKLIKEFRKKHDKPVLKGAYVQESIFVGENTLEALISIKNQTGTCRWYYSYAAISCQERYISLAIRWK